MARVNMYVCVMYYYHLTVKLDSKQFSHLNIIILNIIVAKFLDGCKTNTLKQVNSLLATPNSVCVPSY